MSFGMRLDARAAFDLFTPPLRLASAIGFCNSGSWKQHMPEGVAVALHGLPFVLVARQAGMLIALLRWLGVVGRSWRAPAFIGAVLGVGTVAAIGAERATDCLPSRKLCLWI